MLRYVAYVYFILISDIPPVTQEEDLLAHHLHKCQPLIDKLAGQLNGKVDRPQSQTLASELMERLKELYLSSKNGVSTAVEDSNSAKTQKTPHQIERERMRRQRYRRTKHLRNGGINGRDSQEKAATTVAGAGPKLSNESESTEDLGEGTITMMVKSSENPKESHEVKPAELNTTNAKAAEPSLKTGKYQELEVQRVSRRIEKQLNAMIGRIRYVAVDNASIGPKIPLLFPAEVGT
jgi:hypothetical protein